ncbi:hypothetical protein [Nitrosopumilus cobalaminigenes]|uniref:hypothetical protein n=1 Tax=Nitrosopumilus cobalaminigenes TaxID=1470066 RepID=UPI0015CCCFA2|nr:hypothetical protein [Nitrosopumilus cobalaminigenes]
MDKSNYGLTDTCRASLRCDRCDLPLHCSTYNDVKIVYSTSVAKDKGFHCIRCAVNKKKVTTEEIEQTISQLVRVN